MHHLQLNRRSLAATMRVSVVLMLTVALLAPKVSLAASLWVGNGYRSVLVCTGTQLVRVTVAPDGEVVDDVTEEWVAPHCVVSDQDVAVLRRMWSLADYPCFAHVAPVPDVPLLPLPRRLGLAILSRGPPPQA